MLVGIFEISLIESGSRNGEFVIAAKRIVSLEGAGIRIKRINNHVFFSQRIDLTLCLINKLLECVIFVCINTLTHEEVVSVIGNYCGISAFLSLLIRIILAGWLDFEAVGNLILLNNVVSVFLGYFDITARTVVGKNETEDARILDIKAYIFNC